MAYRDELEAAQARARALEQDLASARAEVRALQGKQRAQALVRRPAVALEVSAATRRSAWLDGPRQLILRRTVAGELPESAFPRLVEEMRQTIGTIGQVSTFAGSLAWASSPQHGCPRLVEITIDVRDGETSIRITERLSLLAGRVYGGGLGGIGGGGLMLPIAVAFLSPALIPIAVAGWLGGIYGVCRRVYRSRAERRADQLDGLANRLAEIAEQAISAAGDIENQDQDEDEAVVELPRRRASSSDGH